MVAREDSKIGDRAAKRMKRIDTFSTVIDASPLKNYFYSSPSNRSLASSAKVKYQKNPIHYSTLNTVTNKKR